MEKTRILDPMIYLLNELADKNIIWRWGFSLELHLNYEIKRKLYEASRRTT